MTRTAFNPWRAALALAGLFLLTLAAPARAETREIQILQTTDLHGYLDRGAADAAAGGWFRLATLIRRERERVGPDRTLLVDCGDTSQGTLVALVSRGQFATPLLETLAYDVWVPGNHEFDFGTRQAAALFQERTARRLCANLRLELDGRPQALPGWRLFTRNGARLAVLGATASYLDNWLWGKEIEGYRVETALQSLARLMPEVLREKPDAIVLAMHQGWIANDPRSVNELPAIVKRFPEIDLILGGHTHRAIPGQKLGAKTWYVQAGSEAESLAVVRLTVDTKRHAVLDISSRLLPADSSIAPDPAARAAALSWLDKSAVLARTPVGVLAKAVSAGGTPGESCEVSELFCQAIAAATGADVVLHGKLSLAGLPAGAVTEADLFAVVPFENYIGVAEISRRELVEILTEQFAQRDSPSFNGLWGLEAGRDKAGTVTFLRFPDGRPVPETARLKLALNSYSIAGAGGRFPKLRAILRIPDNRLRDTGINSREALRTWLDRHRPLTVSVRRWVVNR